MNEPTGSTPADDSSHLDDECKTPEKSTMNGGVSGDGNQDAVQDNVAVNMEDVEPKSNDRSDDGEKELVPLEAPVSLPGSNSSSCEDEEVDDHAAEDASQLSDLENGMVSHADDAPVASPKGTVHDETDAGREDQPTTVVTNTLLNATISEDHCIEPSGTPLTEETTLEETPESMSLVDIRPLAISKETPTAVLLSDPPDDAPMTGGVANGGRVICEATPGVVFDSDVNAEDAEGTTGASAGTEPLDAKPVSGLLQLRALTYKNLLAKRRTPMSTFFEIVSPVGMSLIMVAGYALAMVYSTNASEYAYLHFDIPGQLGGLLETGACVALNETPSFCRGGSSASNSASATNGFAAMNDAQNFFQNTLTHPFPIPTLDQYVLLSAGLSTVLLNDTEQMELLQMSDFGRRFGNLFTLGTVHLSPRGSPVTQELWAYLNDTYPMVTQQGVFNETLNIRVHEDEDAALQYIQDHVDERTWALIDLSGKYGTPATSQESIDNFDSPEYKIRMNYTTLPNTNMIFDWTSVGLDGRYQRYYLSGFLTWMKVLQDFSFRRASEAGGAEGQCETPGQLDYFSVPMPTPSFSVNTFFEAAGYLLGLAVAMGFLFPMSRLVKSVVEEKETRMKQTLQILGVAPWAYWLSWIVIGYIIFMVDAILVTMTLKGSVMRFSNLGLILAYFILFASSIVSFSFFVASFFSRAKLAAIVGPVALFATLMPRWIFYGSNRQEATMGKQIVSLLPCSAFAFGADIVAAYEQSEIGVQTYNMHEGSYSFSTSLGFLFLDTILYGILGWYLDLVLPSQYGVARPWYFPFTWTYVKSYYPKSWWGADESPVDVGTDSQCLPKDENFCCCGRKPPKPRGPIVNVSRHIAPAGNFELVSKDYAACVRLKNLVKRYSRNTPNAVDGVDLDLYENQITCLLGANGAGKTTTISVLTGLFPPTSGECEIYGHSISTDLHLARRSMGVCHQQNVLFGDLTVREHLSIFQQIKGVAPTAENIRGRAEEVGLQDKLNATSSSLSGGMKRKLCLAMALCGDPKFVLLDEPTSGMDPASRRATWDLLRRSKTGRVTLLTTHFMDEADHLADRVAVMKAGLLQCCGSPLFLKKRFGLGYSLNVVVVSELRSCIDLSMSPTMCLPSATEEQVTTCDAAHVEGTAVDLEESSIRGDEEKAITEIRSIPSSSSTVPKPQVQAIENFLARYVPEVKLIRQSGMELTFRFPSDSTSMFPTLFEAFEEERQGLGIGGYGVANTSLEEVFLRLAEWEDCTEEQRGSTVHREDTTKSLERICVDNLSQEASKELSGDKLQSFAAVPINGPSKEKKDTTRNTSAASMNKTYSDESATRLYLGWFGQLRILLWKRYRVQSRDLKGTFFTTILPAILIGLVLLILTVDVPLAGPPIVLSPALYRETPAGVGTQVLVGGTNSADATFDGISASFGSKYPFASMDFLTQATSSLGMSKYLLGTRSAQDHSVRFGAFVFDDVINMTLDVDWDEIKRPTSSLLQASSNAVPVDETTASGQNEDLPGIRGLQFANASASQSSTNTTDLLDVPFFSEGIESAANTTDWIAFVRGFIDFLVSGNSTELLNLNVAELLSSVDLTTALPSGTVRYDVPVNIATSMLHNASSSHAVAAFTQAHMQYLYQQCTQDESANLIMVNHPLPLTAQQSIEVRTILSVFASLFVLIPYCFVPAAFIVFLVKERVCKSKHVQLVSGVDLSAFWVAHYMWDMAMYGFLTVLIMISFGLYGKNSAQVFVGDAESFFCTTLLTFGYGVSSMPLAYLLARNFKNHSSAQIAVLGIFFLFGFVAVNAYFIMMSIERTKAAAQVLQYFFRIFPPYNVGDGLINLSQSYLRRELLGEDANPFDWDVAGKPLALLYGLSAPFFAGLLLLEYSEDGGSGGYMGRFLRRVRSAFNDSMMRLHGVKKSADGRLLLDDGLDSEDEEDADVAEERRNVDLHYESMKMSAPVIVSDLWKVYPSPRGILSTLITEVHRLLCFFRRNRGSAAPLDPSSLPKRAVRGISLAVNKGETFGLLGMNGAGKSSTLSVLTGDITPTIGNAYVAGFDVSGSTTGEVSKARKHIGFCPQVDPLLDLMTGREALHMFGTLRGIPGPVLIQTVNSLMDALTLTPHADKPAHSYSGGNKRKLSLGIALIGDPDVLFIDEASSGMDPGARRKMWELISNVAKNRSVILTTHSMEEAEALCSRLTVMVNGRMRCLGSVQHLKSKYVDGYTMDLQLHHATPANVVESVKQYVVGTAMPRATLLEQYNRFLRFSVPSGLDHDSTAASLGSLFGVMESMKADSSLMVEDYALSQCTLEQVFISFAQDVGENQEPSEHPS